MTAEKGRRAVDYRLVERPAFEVIGRKGWIAGQDDFGRFWAQCQAEGLMDVFRHLSGYRPGKQTGGATLGISRVEQDPGKRTFYYMIAVETPANCPPAALERYRVPAAQWAVFECHGKVPGSIVGAEIYAFMEWLPNAPYVHAHAPEMEVYPPGSVGDSDDNYCEFWLPVSRKEQG
jgi:AraC family transcriptional regulator